MWDDVDAMEAEAAEKASAAAERAVSRTRISARQLASVLPRMAAARARAQAEEWLKRFEERET